MKVLLIAEDPAISELLTVLLRPNQASIISTRSDLEAIESTGLQRPDLVIIDRNKPDGTGWQICRAIRAISPAPILILSAQDDPQQVAVALDAGADLYLKKPVTGNVLLANVKTLLRRSSLANGISFTWTDPVSVL